jgi:hypothetical protein
MWGAYRRPAETWPDVPSFSGWGAYQPIRRLHHGDAAVCRSEPTLASPGVDGVITAFVAIGPVRPHRLDKERDRSGWRKTSSGEQQGTQTIGNVGGNGWKHKLPSIQVASLQAPTNSDRARSGDCLHLKREQEKWPR